MTHAELRALALAWLARVEPALEVIVVQHRGSVPRQSGTRMLVSLDEIAGTIGGGHLELKAIEEARRQLKAKDLSIRDQTYPLGPSLGQCCGGVVTLRTQRLTRDSLDRWPEPHPRFHLQLFGAGHVGRAIVRLLETLDCKVEWVDEREEEFPDGPDARHIERIVTDHPPSEVAHAPAGAAYLVMTHSHDTDLTISEAILRRGDFAYFGVIGSLTKRQRFIHRLAAKGISDDRINRMFCPIGLEGLMGKEPAIIAVSVVAQLLLLASSN